MATRSVTIQVVVGEARIGGWCARCALPSRIEAPIYMLTKHGVTLLKAVAYCAEHGRDGD